MVCDIRRTKRSNECWDLLEALDVIAREAESRQCDVVVGAVAAAMSKHSQYLYEGLEKRAKPKGFLKPARPLWINVAIFLVAWGLVAAWGWYDAQR